MRNDTRFDGFNVNKLTLVDNSQEDDDDAAAYYPYQPGAEDSPPRNSPQAKTTLLVFIAVSVACAAAAIASGSYAAWLSRQQMARQALTDVNDLLKSCQTRMRQLEVDVQRLPNRQA